jgi:hypothetical protein
VSADQEIRRVRCYRSNSAAGSTPSPRVSLNSAFTPTLLSPRSILVGMEAGAVGQFFLGQAERLAQAARLAVQASRLGSSSTGASVAARGIRFVPVILP